MGYLVDLTKPQVEAKKVNNKNLEKLKLKMKVKEKGVVAKLRLRPKCVLKTE